MTECLETTYFVPTEQSLDQSIWTACLIVLKGHSVGDRFLLHKNEMTIGRSETVDVRFAQDKGVSRLHAVIHRIEGDAEQFVIMDKDSFNGTSVNSKKIKKTILKDRDIITISTHKLKFIASTSPEQTHYDELYRQTHMDKALQIYDKHYFLTKLAEEVQYCKRYDNELSLMMFDVDHFKRINDTYGHLAGDAVLLKIVEIVKQRIRETDILCRYGGEEFAIIMPHVDCQQAHVLAEHIRTLIAETPIICSNATINITISLGISSYVQNSTQPYTSELLILQADKALYQAKHTGRNKTMLFDSVS